MKEVLDMKEGALETIEMVLDMEGEALVPVPAQAGLILKERRDPIKDLAAIKNLTVGAVDRISAENLPEDLFRGIPIQNPFHLNHLSVNPSIKTIYYLRMFPFV